MSRMLTRTSSYGSWGAMTGASTATTRATASIARPMSPIRWRRNERQARRGVVAVVGAVTSSRAVIGSSLAHARIEPAIDQLRDQVGDHHREGDDEKGALEDGVVAVA